MISYGVISLLALATVSTASPIGAARRDSSLIPTPPPACLAKANSTALSASNTTFGATTQPHGYLIFKALLVRPVLTTSSTDTATATSSAGNSTDNASEDTSTEISSTNTSSTDTNATDTTTATGTGDATSDSSAPPTSTVPPSGSSSGGDGSSSGIFDPSTGEFTADTSDPSGKRSPLRELCCIQCSPVSTATLSGYSTTVVSHRPTFPLSRRSGRISLASAGDIFTGQRPMCQLGGLAGVTGINALLSTDNADKMIDFAKSPGDKNQDALFAAAIAYRKHPRNAQDLGGGVIPSIPYYTKEPRNQELVGVVNQQLPGVNPGLFGGPNSPVVAFGAE
ncbi:hypothetical protein V8E52_007863 [Russula decolorans]